MNAFFASPLGALLARPWVDRAGLFGLRRYFPLSRLWAAANAAGEDVGLFRDGVGAPLPAFWPTTRLRAMLGRHARLQRAAQATRRSWEEALFDGHDDSGVGRDLGLLDGQRRGAATRHLATRAWFYPLLFPRRPPAARWRIDRPEKVERDLGALLAQPRAFYAAPLDIAAVERSRSFAREGLQEYWLRGATPSDRLRRRPGSENFYARVVEPDGGSARATLIFGSGLCLEFELLAVARDPATRLARLGWRVVEPISPYHGLRAMPGFYGGEPFFAAGPTSAIDLIAGQALEQALLTAWSRAAFGTRVAVAGISMSSFVAQQAASYCDLWPAEARPDAAMLISHSGRVEQATFDGDLAALLGLDRALIEAGWSREALARISRVLDPAEKPALPASRILSVLGETDRWVPYGDGLALAERWRLPDANLFRYPFGHLGMPVQLTRDTAPFDRLMQLTIDAGP
jgi:hypothetical protein